MAGEQAARAPGSRVLEAVLAYPRTWLYAVLAPQALNRPAPADGHARPAAPRGEEAAPGVMAAAPFMAVSWLLAYGLAVAVGQDELFRLYRFPPWAAPVTDAVKALPGSTYIYYFISLAGPLVVQIPVMYLLLKAFRRPSGGEPEIGRFLRMSAYFCGGPLMATQVTALAMLGVGAAEVFIDALSSVGIVSFLFILIYYFAWLTVQVVVSARVSPLWAFGVVLAGFVVATPVHFPQTELFRAGSYRIETESMAPVLPLGSITVANLAYYDWQAPERGDLAVMDVLLGSQVVKAQRRIVGLPGDRVAYRDGRLHLNGEAVAREPAGAYALAGGAARRFIERLPSGASYAVLQNAEDADADEVEVPEGRVYVLGDNRDDSHDSRAIGPVPVGWLIGLIYYRLEPDPGPLP